MLDTIMSWVGYSPTSTLQLAQTRITGLETLTSNLNLIICGLFVLVLILIVALWRRPKAVYLQAPAAAPVTPAAAPVTQATP